MISQEECRELLAEAAVAARQMLVQRIAQLLARHSWVDDGELAATIRDLPAMLVKVEERTLKAMATDFEAIARCVEPADRSVEAQPLHNAHWAKLAGLVAHIGSTNT